MAQPKFYPYRTTVADLEKAQGLVEEAGDQVVSAHFVAGRDMLLLCRRGTDGDEGPNELSQLLQQALEPLVLALCVIANQLTPPGSTPPYDAANL